MAGHFSLSEVFVLQNYSWFVLDHTAESLRAQGDVLLHIHRAEIKNKIFGPQEQNEQSFYTEALVNVNFQIIVFPGVCRIYNQSEAKYAEHCQTTVRI